MSVSELILDYGNSIGLAVSEQRCLAADLIPSVAGGHLDIWDGLPRNQDIRTPSCAERVLISCQCKNAGDTSARPHVQQQPPSPLPPPHSKSPGHAESTPTDGATSFFGNYPQVSTHVEDGPTDIDKRDVGTSGDPVGCVRGVAPSLRAGIALKHQMRPSNRAV